MEDRPFLERVIKRASDPAARALLHRDVHHEVGQVLAALSAEELGPEGGARQHARHLEASEEWQETPV